MEPINFVFGGAGMGTIQKVPTAHCPLPICDARVWTSDLDDEDTYSGLDLDHCDILTKSRCPNS